ncbi:MAG: hypothetical protein IT464_09040 [Planctomycetes bacterium]|nr:hypothetical protein [Planctomycetota bacterium]
MGRGYIKEYRENPTDELGGGTGTAARFTVQFIGKMASRDYPYAVANETVASAIGLVLGLPVAPGITDEIGGQPYFFSQEMRKYGDKQFGPGAGAVAMEKFVRQNQLLIHGAIVFDLFIANNDRAFLPARRNLALDDDGNLFLYDHGNSCFYRPRESPKVVAGIVRLKTVEASLAAMFDKGSEGNLYWEALSDIKMTDHWLKRIQQIPDFMLESFVNMIPAAVNPPDEAERAALVEFLKKRRHYLREHILADRAHFPNLGGPT